MKAIGYIRVSTAGQVSDGVSLDTQVSKIRAWCELNGYELGGIFSDEGISGTRIDREGLAEAISALKRGEALVVYSLSRFGRNTKHTLELAEQLERKGVDLVSVSEKIDTTCAAGKMVFRMLAVLSEFERDQIGERTSAAMQHKKSKNERIGSIPYGSKLSDDGVTLLNDECEQQIIRLVKTLRHNGLSYREIAEALEERGMKPRGKKWHAQTLKNIAA